MRKLFLSILAAALLLSACAPAAAPTAAAAAPAAAGQAGAYPAGGQAAPQAAINEAAAYPVSGGAAAANTRVTFKIAPGESKVQYEVGETFLNQNNRVNLAVGITSTISGEIYADKANPPASTLGPITVDISKFASDSNRRDSMIQNNYLESLKYPQAKFVPTQFASLPAAYQEGTDYTFKVTGDLTVKTVTKPVTFDVNAKLVGDTLTGQATTEILMSTYGVGPISILGILNTEDTVKITLTFVARP
jgi:polyisoprenoid-binding protein YceI